MTWWAWLGSLLLVWVVAGVGLSLFLGLGIGEADRRRPRRRELTPEDVTDPLDRPPPPPPAPRRQARRRPGPRVGRSGGALGTDAAPHGGEDGPPPPATEDRP